MKKWISRIIDILLVLVIGLLGYVEVSMLVTKDRNNGIPQAFGMSFLYVVTDSMEVPNDPKSLGVGTGIVIKKTSVEKLKCAKPVYEYNAETGEQKLVDYDTSTGDIVTFICRDRKIFIVDAPDTHRVIGKEYREDEGKWYITTMGDNPIAHVGIPSGRGKTETWPADDLVGKVIFHSKALGTMLVISSPAVARSVGKRAWFFPIAILVPIATIVTITMVQAFVKYRKEEKEREAQLLVMMQEAGIDMNDPIAVELFRTKEEIRLEMKEEMEKEKEKARKLALKELKKKEKHDESKN